MAEIENPTLGDLVRQYSTDVHDLPRLDSLQINGELSDLTIFKAYLAMIFGFNIAENNVSFVQAEEGRIKLSKNGYDWVLSATETDNVFEVAGEDLAPELVTFLGSLRTIVTRRPTRGRL